MRRVAIGVFVAAVLLAGWYLTRRPSVDAITGTPSAPPPPASAPGVCLETVEFVGPSGSRLVRPADGSFSLPAPAGLRGDITLTGAGPDDLRAGLVEYNPLEASESPVCELPVSSQPGGRFRVVVPRDRVERGHVYRVRLVAAGTGQESRYGFNVANQ